MDDELISNRLRVDLIRGPFPIDLIQIIQLLTGNNQSQTVIEVKKIEYNGFSSKLETYGFFQFGSKSDVKSIISQVNKAHPELSQWKNNAIYVMRLIGENEIRKFTKQVYEKDMLIDILNEIKSANIKYHSLRPYLAIQVIEKNSLLIY